MRALELITLQGINTVEATAAIGAVLARRLADAATLRVVCADDFIRQRARLLRGDLDIGWMCAATYARVDHAADAPLELLAAPQWAHARYGGLPRYAADVIVRADHPAARFDDLAGARLAFNEPGSLSGYLSVLDALAQRGATRGFFAAAIAVGAHHHAVDAVLDGRADTAAIDSTVLDYLVARRADLAERLRVIDTFGPLMAPPWTIARRVPPDVRARLRAELCALHTHDAGRAALALGALARFAAATDDDYTAIVALARRAATVSPV